MKIMIIFKWLSFRNELFDSLETLSKTFRDHVLSNDISLDVIPCQDLTLAARSKTARTPIFGHFSNFNVNYFLTETSDGAETTTNRCAFMRAFRKRNM